MPVRRRPPSWQPHTAAILAIGDEVLRGEITNTNATFLSERLFDAGLEVCEQRVVADEAAAMRRALEELAQRAAVVVVSGGLGPTEDDRTVDVVADLLGVKADPHSASLDAMKKRFCRAWIRADAQQLAPGARAPRRRGAAQRGRHRARLFGSHCGPCGLLSPRHPAGDGADLPGPCGARGCGPTWPRTGCRSRPCAPGTSTAWANRTSITAWPSCSTTFPMRPCTFAPTRPRTTSRWSSVGPTRARTRNCWSRWIANCASASAPGSTA